MSRIVRSLDAVEVPHGWSHEGRSLYRSVGTDRGLGAERIIESLHATARSAGRDVDVVEDDARLVVRLPLPEGRPTPGDAEVCARLEKALDGGADVPGAE